MRTFAVAALTLDAARHGAACPPWPGLRSLAEAIVHALASIAAALRFGRAAPAVPLLSEMQRSLADRIESESQRDPALVRHATGEPGENAPDRNACPPLYRLAISETALMVDSVETMAALLVAPQATPSPTFSAAGVHSRARS